MPARDTTRLGPKDFAFRFVAIYRQPADLVASRIATRRPSPVIQVVPLEELEGGVYPFKDRLVSAWKGLSEVSEFGPETLARAVTVLIETVRDELAEPLGLQTMAALLRHTPKVSRLPPSPRPHTALPIDMRAALHQPKQTNELLQRCQPHWKPARDLLIGFGYDPERLPGSLPAAADPYHWYNFGLQAERLLPVFPERFYRTLWPLLRGQTLAEAVEWIGLYRALELDRDDLLRLWISDLLSRQRSEITLQWVRHLLEVEPDQRCMVIGEAIHTGGYEREPPPAAIRW